MDTAAAAIRVNDARLPVEKVSLQKFNDTAYVLGKVAMEDTDTEKVAKWLEYGIAGIEAGETRVAIDMEDNEVNEEWRLLNADTLQYRHDYDSLMGRSDTMPYTTPVEIFPTFTSGFFIKKSLHITPMKFSIGGETHSFQEYQAPQVILGHTCTKRATIYLILPALINWEFPSERSVSASILAELYDDCIYPAALETIHAGENGHWPPSYETELKRARGPTGHLQSSGKLVPKNCADAFGKAILQSVRQKNWGKSAYYFHDIQGTRGQSQHAWKDRKEKLTEYLEFINTDLIDAKSWWIDLAQEIQCPGWVLWLRTDAHTKIISKILRLSTIATRRIMRTRAYSKDLACQLEAISGFRLEVPDGIRQRDGIAYIQVYNTEKEAMYFKSDRGQGHGLPYRKVVLDAKYKIQDYHDKVANILKTHLDNSDGHFRLELRVCLNNVLADFQDNPRIDLSPDKLEDVIYAFERAVWWGFKLTRVATACTAISWWQNAKEGRTDDLSICLVIALVYMLNSLHSRPVELEAETLIQTRMMAATSVSRMEDGLEFTVNNLGCFFPSSVIADPTIAPAPRVGPNCALSERVFERLFDRSRFSVQLDVDKALLAVSSKTTTEIAGRIRRTYQKLPARGPSTEEEVINIPAHLDLLGKGPLKVQSSLQTTAEELGRHVTGIVARMYMDLLVCSPNPIDPLAKSYCRLKNPERRSATIRLFQEPNLAVVWRRVLVLDDSGSWDKAVSSLFPFNVQEGMPLRQHYKTCGFYLEWRSLVTNISFESRRELVALVKTVLDQLLWLPWAKADRIWHAYSIDDAHVPKRSQKTIYPEDETDSAPIIVLNPKWGGQRAYFDATHLDSAEREDENEE